MSDETIFLTGFPGFIAGRLVERLASETDTRFLLLVERHLISRTRESVAHIASKTGAPIERFEIVEGDITQDSLGMSADDFARARERTTAVFHLAAIYNLGVERDVAMRVNVEGTRRVNEFAVSIKNQLRRYDYVSTCYVAGLRTGKILESELRHEAGFRNFYEETKYLAEIEVDDLKGELPVAIYRPSVVCGDSQTGETAKYDGIYYLIRYLLKWPQVLSLANIGNRRVRLNIVPVDFVVEAMAALFRHERATGKTVQLADPQPLTTYELFETIARALNRRGSRLDAPPQLVRRFLQLRPSEIVTGMPGVAVPYFFIDQTYDTTEAERLLKPHGIVCPSFPSYVGALIEFVKQHPKL